MKTFLAGAKGLGTYLIVAAGAWVFLSGWYGWGDHSFDAVGGQLNSRDLFLHYVVFPVIALCWPLALLLVGAIDAGGRRLGFITDFVPKQQ